MVGWPTALRDVLHVGWNYWWQAHLLDCLIDAELREPRAERRAAINRLIRGIRLRNQGGWLNDYYDDIAWLGIALLRAERATGMSRPAAVRAIRDRLHAGWSSAGGGGLWWRVGDDFKNTPANGPAAIMLARLGERGDPDEVRFAASLVDWMEEHLLDPETGLLWDGLRVDADGGIVGCEKNIYSYCQGVFLGACLDLARITGRARWRESAVRTVNAVATNLRDQHGVLRGHGGGDGGLFTGILTRYLAQAAVELPVPGTDSATTESADLAAEMVRVSAEAAWATRDVAPGGPLFSARWSTPFESPPVMPLFARHEQWSRRVPEYDLSVQLSGWMLLEAAASLEKQPRMVTSVD